jgi:hypothetical protein
MMKFETAVMRKTFDDAEALAISGRLWSSAIPTPEPLWRGLFKRQPTRAAGPETRQGFPILVPGLGLTTRMSFLRWRQWSPPWRRRTRGATGKSLFLEVAGAQLFDVRRIGAEVRRQAQAGVARRAAHRVLVGQLGRRVEARAARLALEVADGAAAAGGGGSGALSTTRLAPAGRGCAQAAGPPGAATPLFRLRILRRGGSLIAHEARLGR